MLQMKTTATVYTGGSRERGLGYQPGVCHTNPPTTASPSHMAKSTEVGLSKYN